jgi:pimeloyl-ACP methyl ester carboxylesterase
VKRISVVVLVLVLALVVGSAAAVLLLRGGPDDTAGNVEAAPAAVILIPGYGGDPAGLGTLGTALADAGYATSVLDIGDGTGDLRDYGRAAVQEAQRLRDAGAPAVSSVGFSAGGVIGRIAAQDDPQAFDDVISLASPHSGTLLAALGGANCPIACQQLQPGSELLASLGPAPDQETWFSVYSTTDEVIIPASSSALEGATLLPIQELCPDLVVRHGEVPVAPVTIGAVTAFLAGQPLPAACPAR